MRRFVLITLVALLAGVGCAADTADERALPTLDSKSDFASNVSDKGFLAWDTPAQSELTNDLEYHAYSFEIAAGGKVTFEVTQAGSSRGLATVAVLYGPPDADGDRARLAVDYDSGWGALSRIRGFVAEETGLYVALVGSADGFGRGNYQVRLGCDEGTCEVIGGGTDARPLDLTEGEPNTEFMETMNRSDEYCWSSGRAFSYPATDDETVAQAGVAIRNLYQEELEIDPEVDEITYDGEVTLAAFDGFLDYMGLTRGDFEGAVGRLGEANYRVGRVTYAYGCAPSVTCSAQVMVVVVPDWDEVWTAEYGCGDE